MAVVLQRILTTAWLIAALLVSVTVRAQDDELLDPEVAFATDAALQADGTLAVFFNIADGYYLYRHAFKFSSTDAPVSLGEARIPPGKKKEDEWFGEVETYRGKIKIDIPVVFSGDKPSMFFVEAGFQGCADLGVCFPPQKRLLQINTAAIASNGTPPSGVADVVENNVPAQQPPPADGAGEQSEQDRIAATLAQGASLATLLIFFGFGLALAFTPCVFPMIPILSGIIVGQGAKITTRRAFVLSLVYVLAMALTYTAAGVIVGLSGDNVQAMFQNPWVLGSFAAIFVLLSLSMFGFYELQMPSGIQSKLTSISNNQQSGTLIGAAIMGFLSSLIVGPCVTAPLIGALLYIAQTRDAVLGGAALFSLSLGMGAPLLIIGTSAGKLLPRAGGWMEAVKAFFGVALLAVAIWLVSRVLPEQVTLLLSAALAIGSAIYLGALEPLPAGHRSWPALWKALGLLLLLYGVMLLIGAATGKGSLSQPLHGLAMQSGKNGGGEQHLVFKRFKGVDGLQAELDAASAGGQPVMLDLYADWCVSCKEMENFTFTDAGVQKSLASFALIQADVTVNDDADKALLKQLGVFGPPAIVFYDKAGNEIPGRRIVGYVEADKFSNHVQQILGNL